MEFSTRTAFTASTAEMSRVQWITATAVILLAGLLRFSYVSSVVVDSPWRADAGKYVALAINLVANGTYSLAQEIPFTPTHYVTPGYPAYLAVFLGLSETVHTFNSSVLLSQAALGTLTVFLTFLLGRAAGGVGVGLAAALLLAISPHHIASSGYLLTETLFTFLTVLTSWMAIVNWKRQQWWLWMVIGAIAAAASLVRPVFLIFPLIMAIPLLLQGTTIRKIVYLVFFTSLGITLTNLPWQIWKADNPAGAEPNLLAAAIQLGGYPDLIYKDPTFKGFPYRDDPENSRSATIEGAVHVITERAAAAPERYLRWYFIDKPIMFWQSENLGAAGGAFIYPIIDSIYSRHYWAAWSKNVMMLLHPLLAAIAAATILWLLLRALKGDSTIKGNTAALLSAALFGTFTAVHMILGPLQRYAYPVYPFAYLLGTFGLARLAMAARQTSVFQSVRNW